MRTAVFIPIKANSERVPGKNFRVLNGKKLYEYICEHVKEADVFDDVYIDTNSSEISDYAKENGFKVIERKPELAGTRPMVMTCWSTITSNFRNMSIISSCLPLPLTCSQSQSGDATRF